MSLLCKIGQISSTAARDLEEAGFTTDPEIKSLDRTDIYELFPGKKNLKLRKDITEVIHRKRPVDDLVRELKDFIPHESAIAHGRVLADYLCILKEMKTQVDSVQNFLNAHISLLEEVSNHRPRQKTDALPDAKTSDSSGPETLNCGTINTPPEIQVNEVKSGLDTCNKNSVHSRALGNQVIHPSKDLQDLSGRERRKVEAEVGGSSSIPLPWPKEVKYNMVVSGTTHNALRQLMHEVMNDDQARSFRFSESRRDHQVTLLFRSITSRMESDVGAAMIEINDDKPVILVLMHHLLEPTSSVRSCNDHRNVVLQVHVFFHETKSGLLKCTENRIAISDTRNKLLEYCTQMIPEENLKCESERRKEPEFGDKKQDLYDNKRNSQKGLIKKSAGSFLSSFFGH